MIKTKCARKWLENVHNTPESRRALIEKYKEWNVNENMPEQIYSENEKTNEHRVIEEENRSENVRSRDEMNIQGNCEIMVKEQPKNIQAKMACKEEDKRGDENGDETAEVQNWEKIKEIVRKKLKKGEDKSETDSAIGSRSDQSTGSREDILERTDINHEVREEKEAKNMEPENEYQRKHGRYGRKDISERTVQRFAWGRVKGRLREKETKMEDHNETDLTMENWSDSTIKSKEEVQGASALEENIFNIFTMRDDEGESSLHDTQSESDESIKRGENDKTDDDRLTPTFMEQRRKARKKRTRRGSKCMSCGIDCNMNIPDEEENMPSRGRHAKNEEGPKQMAEEGGNDRDERRKM